MNTTGRFSYLILLVSTTIAKPPTQIDLQASGIHAVLWATGFRRNYSWLNLPVVDEDGELIHSEGVTPIPGLYALGLNFMRRRNSSFIDGVGADAAYLGKQIAAQLAKTNQVLV